MTMQPRLTLSVMALAWAASAHAQPITDPTRPPPAAALASPVGAIAPARAASAVAPAAGPQLQALQLPTDGSASALVDGRVVRAGDRLGEHTIVAIDARGLTLRSARGSTQLMSLLSGVTKTPSGAPPDTALAASTRKELR